MELQLLIAYLILIHLMNQAYLQSRHWRGLVWFLMGLGFSVSVFGILQHLTFNGKLYWFREMRYGGIPFGPYVNRNHFAGFAELIIPIALVPLVLGKVRRERLFLVSLFALVPIVALLLSASRGGIVSFVVELALLFLLLLVRRIRSKHVLVGGMVVTECSFGSVVDWSPAGIGEDSPATQRSRLPAANGPPCVVTRGGYFGIILFWAQAWVPCRWSFRRMTRCTTARS